MRPPLTPDATAVSPVVWIVTVLVLTYAALHFAASGVRFPIDHPNLGKFDEQTAPLREYLANGAPVARRNPQQYGPVFLFVMRPLLRTAPDDRALAKTLYAIQLVCLIGSFLLTCAALRPLMPAGDTARRLLVVAWLAAIWMNFSPLHTVLALKSVESWELLLIALALYAHLKAWPWPAALAIASAGLIKVLPFVFLYYWLVTDRRTFAYACAVLTALLVAGHVVYGPEMGLWYLPRVAAGAGGSSYGLDWHENVSLKAAFAKSLGYLPPPSHDAMRTSGYYLVLAGWRRTAAIILGDVSVIAGFAALTWTWLSAGAARSQRRILWEWSALTVALLILSPNTIFEYLTLALGAISYAFVRILTAERRSASARALFTASLFFMGGVVPRSWLNRLTMIDTLNQWTRLTHLSASEAYQYYCFPLAGLVLLMATCGSVGDGELPRHDRTRPR